MGLIVPDALRRLTAAGIVEFEHFLDELRRDGTIAVPVELLTDSRTSEATVEGVELCRNGFATKREAARYLSEALTCYDDSTLFRDAGLWTWLSIYYFDDVCPGVEGHRKPRANAHYILDPLNHKRRYRHLLATPVQILRAIPEHNRLFLNAPLPIHGDIVEQTMSRLYLIRIPAACEAIELLYYDEAADRPKRGITNKVPRRGDLRNRFPRRLEQLGMTYDIGSMSGEELIMLLGPEFRAWRPQDLAAPQS